ncbi:DNA adenine methylase [uncultured Methanoregula sp.]|uniref:DNA adenine methylase n=1 Tax=uncultured Methanoregula sp. TaxID=1005933 RepID=UPI002AAB686D|nr:DNA adenine methylase [uncultured Methanoregula sp.]
MKAPLIKWAGGKRQLLVELNARLPLRWNTYFEPFIGGGALLVDLENRGLLSGAVISDLNRELINLYRATKTRPDQLIEELSRDDLVNEKESYRQLKAEFNSLVRSNKDRIRRAALLVYLNKHGYNGLWRVNRKGEFNVPFGHHAKKSLPSETAIRKFHSLLQKVTIRHTDFETTVKPAKNGDFVYFDPPYHPVSKTANFTDYHASGFRFGDQERLAKTFRKLADKGVYVMLSNSNVPAIKELYEGFSIATVPAKRYINCNGERRSGTFEIIVTSY